MSVNKRHTELSTFTNYCGCGLRSPSAGELEEGWEVIKLKKRGGDGPGNGVECTEAGFRLDIEVLTES